MTNARELSARLATLLRDEHSALADFLVALASFDERRLWAELGYTSLFVFLHRELRLSKGAAQYRKTAAELVQRVPEIVEPIKDGRLCLTVVVELARVLTRENRNDVLPRFFHLSRQEAMEVVAELTPRPAPPLRQVTTAVRASPPAMFAIPAPSSPAARPVPVASVAAAESRGRPADLVDANSTARSSGSLPQPKPERTVVEPVTADLRRLHITVRRGVLEKLAAARDALSHSMPGATDDEIIEAGLDLILAQQAKRKGLVAKPRKEPPPSKGDGIPAHVKRAVWVRDGGCCQWATADGGICGSTLRVQFAHRNPRARGGRPTVENIRLLCAVHNQSEARLDFGDDLMNRYTRQPAPPSDRGPQLAGPAG
jgi:hypothetical protein